MSTTTPLPLRWFPADDPKWQPDGPTYAFVITQNVVGELRRTPAAYCGGRWEGDSYVGAQWDKPNVLYWIHYRDGIYAPPPLELVDRVWLHKMWPTF